MRHEVKIWPNYFDGVADRNVVVVDLPAHHDLALHLGDLIRQRHVPHACHTGSSRFDLA